jgi:hypothetical protein
MELFAVEQHFLQQEREFHADRITRRTLRHRPVREVLAVMAKAGNRQAAEILAGRGVR